MTTPETNSTPDPAAQPTHSSLGHGLLKEVAAKLVAEVREEVREIVDARSGPGTASLEGMSANELARSRTDMAIQRTLMAADRTLMAWVRTSLSLSSFGFTIYKILQGFQQAGMLLPKVDTPRNVGLFLIGLGTAAMVMGLVEYWHALKELRVLKHIRLRRPVLTMSILMTVMGLVLFVAVISKAL
jgi:putative membrane protein